MTLNIDMPYAKKENKDITTWADLWKYICDKKMGSLYVEYYTENPDEKAKVFWDAVLSILTAEGKIKPWDADKIWKEIEKGKIYS